MASRERHMHVTRTTELPSKTYHITKHHFVPIRYEPGVEVIRRPTVEHKVITSGNILTGQKSSHGFSGPRRKETIKITRSPTVTYDDVGGSGRSQKKTVVKVVGGGVIGDGIISNSHESHVQHPQNFMNMQQSMEGELERRRTDWESEVEKMQHNFFDMKTSDASKNKMKDSDLRPRSGEILTVGDSHNLYHELPDGSKVYRQKFDLYGFDTDDLSVRAENGKLIITASREDDYDGATSMRQFNRAVDIPETVDQDQISSFLGEDGILSIEAPVIERRLQEEDDSASMIRRTHTEVVEQEPTFGLSSRSRFDDSFPPGFDEVVETTTRSSSNSSNMKSPAAASSLTRTRALGPDVEDTPHGRKLKTTLYIGRKYKQDDITVKLYDYKISVEAKSEETVAGRTARRQFSRDVDIPGPVERGTFVAVLGTDGKLYLGGSFSGNENHDAVLDSVNNDMPSGGRAVNIMF